MAAIQGDTNANYNPNVKLQMYSTAGNYDRYDRFGRTIKQKWEKYSGTPATHDEVDYTYDYAGNRLTRDIPSSLYSTDDRDQKYTYDGLHRLKTFDEGTLSGTGTMGSPDREQGWILDQLGNWSTFVETENSTNTLVQNRSHNSVNEIDTDNIDGDADNPITTTTGTDWPDPIYDAAGNMTRIPREIGAYYTLNYDAWNRLIEVRGPGEALIRSWEYDGLGQRIQRDSIDGHTYAYYYNDRWQLLTEVKDGTVQAIYHWHPHYIDALATRMRASDTHHFTFDANFNVTAAVDDSTDTVVERYRYTPYGKVTYLDSSFGVNPISYISNAHLFTGRELDATTGLQLNRHRYYASHLGRWLTRDPIGYDGDDSNLYNYVENQPLIHRDPSGEWWGTGGVLGEGGYVYNYCAYFPFLGSNPSAPADPGWLQHGPEVGAAVAITAGGGAVACRCLGTNPTLWGGGPKPRIRWKWRSGPRGPHDPPGGHPIYIR